MWSQNNSIAHMECEIKKELPDEGDIIENENNVCTQQDADILDKGRQEDEQNVPINDIDPNINSLDRSAEKNISEYSEQLNESEQSAPETEKNQANEIRDVMQANDPEASQKDSKSDIQKAKKRKFKLEVDIDIGKVYGEEFDAFTDDNNVFRKYRLRQKNKAPPNLDEAIEHKKPKIDDEDSEVNPCDHCKMSFDSKTGLLNHLRIHAVQQKFICALCDTDFDTNVELKQHKQVHESEKRSFICEKCKVAFSDHCDYLLHEISHMNRLSYKCVECGMKYTKRGQFQNHIKTHFNKTTTCPICSKDVSDSCFQGHVNNHGYKRECVECGKILKGSAYIYHMTTHTGVKLHQCVYCGKGFANQQQKKVHTRTHTDERPYECKVCNRWFRQSTDVKRHMDTHKTEKSVACIYCDKKFYHQESLRMHMRIHLNRDLFTCNICGKKFQNMGGLRSHTMYKHLDDRPFKCEACDISFKDKESIKRHNLSRNHRNNMYGFMKKTKE